MTPESFGRALLPLFLRICAKNGVTDALLACVIFLRHPRHGALVNKGDAMAEWLTRRGRVSASNRPNWRSAEVWSTASRATDILESSSDSFNWANRQACRGLHTRTLVPEPQLNVDYNVDCSELGGKTGTLKMAWIILPIAIRSRSPARALYADQMRKVVKRRPTTRESKPQN